MHLVRKCVWQPPCMSKGAAVCRAAGDGPTPFPSTRHVLGGAVGRPL